MSSRFVILRRELAANAVDVISRAYPEQLKTIQMVQVGDGAELKQIRWAAMTPDWSFEATGFPQAYKAQRITLELQARCDYLDRTLDARFALLCQVLEDFTGWGQPVSPNSLQLKDVLTSSESDGITVLSVTPESGSETIENEDFVVSYRLSCLVCGKQ